MKPSPYATKRAEARSSNTSSQTGSPPHREPRLRGIVKWFNDAKGYGFITPEQDGAKDIFVHFTGIAGTGHRTLHEGAEVEYSAGDSDKGPQAIDVVVIAQPEARA